MKTYQDKAELIQAIQNKYQKYITEFAEIPESMKDIHFETIDRSPSENLSYQLGWINLLLKWERLEQRGIEVITPAIGHKWNQLGKLYLNFYQQYGNLTLDEQGQQLTLAVNQLCAWLNGLPEATIFKPQQRKWATTQAQWPIYKWVHINTVAPFSNFRTKIRKWKKLSHLIK